MLRGAEQNFGQLAAVADSVRSSSASLTAQHACHPADVHSSV